VTDVIEVLDRQRFPKPCNRLHKRCFLGSSRLSEDRIGAERTLEVSMLQLSSSRAAAAPPAATAPSWHPNVRSGQACSVFTF
jgi:hypothetical protein